MIQKKCHFVHRFDNVVKLTFFFFHNRLFWPRTLPYIYTILVLLTTGKCNKRKESTTNGEYTKTKYENLKIKSKY